MKSKKDVVFCFRVDDQTDKLIREYAAYNGVSASFYMRKIVNSWLVSRGLLSRGSK